jgi:hypothetical protein
LGDKGVGGVGLCFPQKLFGFFLAVQEERQRNKEKGEGEVESTSGANNDMPVEKILEAERNQTIFVFHFSLYQTIFFPFFPAICVIFIKTYYMIYLI